MASEPLTEELAAPARPAAPLRRLPARLRQPDRARVVTVAGAIALLGIIIGSLVFVTAAAQGGAQYLSPYLHRHPQSWMAGPLAGLWPGRPRAGRWLQAFFLIDLTVMLTCYVVALRVAARMRRRLLWGAVVGVHVVFLLSPPLLLSDLLNYAQYARMGAVHGLNPYLHVPFEVRHDSIFHFTTWRHMPSAYGPLFTLATYALIPLGLTGFFWAFKALLAIASIGLLVLIGHVARRLGRNANAAVVLCGFNPLVLTFGLGGDHNDVFTMLPVIGAIALMLRRREAAGAAAMVGAVALKASAAVLLPVTLLAGGRWRRTFAGAAAGALVLGGVTLLVFGVHTHGVTLQSRLVADYSIPNMVGLALGKGGETASIRSAFEVVLAIGTIAIAIWAWRRRAPIAGLGWATTLIIATLGWDMPWYLIWLLPFLALVASRRFRLVAGLLVVWMTIQWLPLLPIAAHAVGVRPERGYVYCVNRLTMYRLLGQTPKRLHKKGCAYLLHPKHTPARTR